VTSIYQRALGDDFERLHPRVRERFGIESSGGRAVIGRGTMDEVWRGPFWTVPFLWLGAWRNILFPEHGEGIPFEVQNWAYRDRFGRETVTWQRTLFAKKPRRFDAFMIFSEARGCIVDYLGTHQHVAVDLEFSVDARGGLALRSRAQRFYEGPLAFRFPLLFSGVANVVEWFDDVIGRHRIEVSVTNAVFGELFGYRGRFDVEWVDATEGAPDAVLPVRTERRE